MTDRSRPPLPALPETQFIGLDAAALGLLGPRASYRETGPRGAAEGLPVLLLHGIGSNATGWRYVLDDLGESRRVIAWNAPGYWLSDGFANDSPRIEDYADAAAALLSALGVVRAHVVGSSFGGLIAAGFAARHPGRVGSLTLLGASAGFRSKSAEERAQRLAMRAESIREGGLALAAGRWQRLVAADSPPEVVTLLQRTLAATHPRGMMQAASAIDSGDLISDFAPRITAPTLVGCGSEDQINPVPVSEAIAAAIPGARLAILPGVGHISKLEAPRALAALLRAHVKTGEATR
jgi:pimeloyl-ACP methyl ester carboxylesterase